MILAKVPYKNISKSGLKKFNVWYVWKDFGNVEIKCLDKYLTTKNLDTFEKLFDKMFDKIFDKIFEY